MFHRNYDGAETDRNKSYRSYARQFSLLLILPLILGTVAVMLWYCWQLTLLSLVTVVLTLTATKLMAGKMRQASPCQSGPPAGWRNL